MTRISRILGCTTQPIPHTGGASTHLENLRDSITANGVTLDIYSWNSVPLIDRIIGRLRSGMLHRNKGLSLSLEASISLYSKHLESFLERTSPQALSIQTVHAMHACMRCAKLRGLPKLLTVHGYLAYEAESAGALESESESKLLIEHERIAYESADLILAVDNRIRDHIIGLVPNLEPKVRVWPNSPGEGFVKNLHGIDKKLARNIIRVPQEAYLVLCPRRLVPKNGVVVAMKAMKYLKSEGDLLLCFAGDGPLLEILKKERPAGMKDRVRFLGNIEHNRMPYYYRAADLVIIPSIPDRGVEEATSISALEASASGVPVIATNIGGLRDLFAGTGSALMIPPNDERALAQAIILLRRNAGYAQEIGKRGQNLVTERFSSEKWVKRFLAFLDEARE